MTSNERKHFNLGILVTSLTYLVVGSMVYSLVIALYTVVLKEYISMVFIRHKYSWNNVMITFSSSIICLIFIFLVKIFI